MSESQNPQVGNVGQANPMVDPLNTPVNAAPNAPVQVPITPPVTPPTPTPVSSPPAPSSTPTLTPQTPSAPPVQPPTAPKEKTVELQANDYVCLDCAEKKSWKRKPGEFPANRCKVCGLIKNGAKVDEYEK